MARVRYMVNDPAASAAFYTEHFGFEIELEVPAIYIVSRGKSCRIKTIQKWHLCITSGLQ